VGKSACVLVGIFGLRFSTPARYDPQYPSLLDCYQYPSGETKKGGKDLAVPERAHRTLRTVLIRFSRGAGALQVLNLSPSWVGFDPQTPPLGLNRNTNGPHGPQNGNKSRTFGPFRQKKLRLAILIVTRNRLRCQSLVCRCGVLLACCRLLHSRLAS
jgi:hypothetical protein